MIAISADPSRELTLYFRINRDGNITFNFESLDLSTYSIVVNFKTRKDDSANYLQLTSSSGLTIGTNTVALAMSKANAATFREQTYFWEMVRTKSGGEKDWLTGDAVFHYGKFDGLENQTETLTIYENGSTVSVTVTDSSPAILSSGTYSTTLAFNQDKDIYHDATGASITFTLGTGNVNGVGIFLRLNKPTAVTFPANFEASSGSTSLDSTKLNCYSLIYFSNWNGSGTARVIYSNSTFTSL